jgi:hypothetical protein
MNRKRRIEAMAQSLRSAVEMNDWQTMATINHEVATLLSGVTASGGLADEEWTALAQLRNAQYVALEHCVHEFEKVGRRIAELSENKEGWIAYALGTHAEEFKA